MKVGGFNMFQHVLTILTNIYERYVTGHLQLVDMAWYGFLLKKEQELGLDMGTESTESYRLDWDEHGLSLH